MSAAAARVPKDAIEATVRRVLPNEMFSVETDQGDEIAVHVSGELRVSVVRLLPGDRVLVDRSPFDTTKGRIVARARGRNHGVIER